MLQHLIRIFLAVVICSRYSFQNCVPPTDTDGGYFEPYQTVYQYGEEIHYTCEYGHNFVSGALTRTCQGISKINAAYWSGKAPECALVDCNQPDITNAYFERPEITTYQATMRYRCNDGLAPLGYQLAECTANATWRYTPCREPEFHCPQPPEVSHARPNVSQTRQQHGTAIHYICNSGYAMHGVDETLSCQQTSWVGSLPTCVAIQYPSTTLPPIKQLTPLSKNALSIVAGVVTAILLTTALTITVLCIRKRQQKSEQANSETIATPVADTSLAATQHRQHPGEPIKLSGSGTLPGCSNNSHGATADLTLPYHLIQCPHDHRPMVGIENRKRNNYVPDSHFRPLFSNYEQAQSSSPSTVQSEVSVTDSEFHTIRECLGDFKNNNLPTSASTPVIPQTHIQSPVHHSNTIAHTAHQPQPHPHPHNLFTHGSRTAGGPFTRTLWTADGRPYEAVTCPHGIDHVYQPLEHIYEEPHIWMRPLPDPQQ